jgi:hypothetical protein
MFYLPKQQDRRLQMSLLDFILTHVDVSPCMTSVSYTILLLLAGHIHTGWRLCFSLLCE